MKKLHLFILLSIFMYSQLLAQDWAIKPQYKRALDFYEGVAVVLDKDDKYFLIDTKGNIVKSLEQYMDVRQFQEGLAQVMKKEGDNNYLIGFIDKTGREVIKPQYTPGMGSVRGSGFCEGLYAAMIGEFKGGSYIRKCGYIDKTGKVIIPFKYGTCGDFSEGLAPIVTPGKDGMNNLSFINKQGKVVISERVFGNEYSSFYKGVALVEYVAIDKTGKELGYVDISDNSIINQKTGKKVGTYTPRPVQDILYKTGELVPTMEKENVWGYVVKK
jgi:hypothetical protein